METTEIWKPVEQFLYIEASSKGRIKILPHKNKKGRIVSEFCKDKDGYCKITTIKKDGTITQTSVHRMVALAFIPNPENKTCVNHIDGVRTNNCVENLEWVTPKENVYHSFLYGQRKKVKVVPRTTLLTDYQISQIDNLRKIYTLNQIAKLFNIDYQSIKNIVHKRKHRERLDNQQPSNYKEIYN